MATGFGFVFDTRWNEVAMTYATSQGYSFSDACFSDLSAFLAAGYARVEGDGEPDTHRYDSLVKRVVQTMIEEVEAGGTGDKVLHEWTMYNARIKICPLFPFC